MTYELFYSTGGHGGPYQSLQEARDSARGLIAGCRTLDAVYIMPRDERPFDRRNAVELVRRTSE